ARSPYQAALQPLFQHLTKSGGSLNVAGVKVGVDELERLRNTQALYGSEWRAEPGGELERALVIVGGPSGEDLRAWLSEVVARQGGAVELTTREDARLGTIYGLGQLSVAEVREVAEGFLIVGTPGAFEHMRASAYGEPRSSVKAGQLWLLCAQLRCADALVGAAAEMTAELRPELPRALRGILAEQTLSEMDWVTARIDAHDGVQVQVAGTMRSADAATMAANDVRDRMRGLTSGMQGVMLSALGVRTLIEQVQASADGSRLDLSLSLSDPETRSLLARVDGLM